jgi:hypothetical protein
VHNAQSLARPPRSVRRLRSFIVLSRAAAYIIRYALGQDIVGRSNFSTDLITYHGRSLDLQMSRSCFSVARKNIVAGPRSLNDGQSGTEHTYFSASFRLVKGAPAQPANAGHGRTLVVSRAAADAIHRCRNFRLGSSPRPT